MRVAARTRALLQVMHAGAGHYHPLHPSNLSSPNCTNAAFGAGWLQEAMDAHARAYHLAKNPRQLRFAPALGAVELDVEIGSATQARSARVC